MRRGFLLTLVAGVALSGCGRGGTDRPDLPARIVLEGPPAAQHVGLYVAAVRGYDEAEGVTMRIVAAASAATAPRLLVTGRAQLAVMDLNRLARERERGRDLVALAAVVQRPVAAFARRALGRPVDVAGAPRYPELVVVATRAGVTTEPALARAALAAARRGYEEEISDPAAAADVMLSRVTRLDRDALLADLSRIDDAFTGAGGRVGELDRRALAAWSRWAVANGIVRRAPDVARLVASPG